MKKINIGIVLIIIVIIALAIHIVTKEKTIKQDFNNIELVLNDYFKVYNKYSLLPEDDRDITKSIDEKKYNSYLSDLKKDLSNFVLDEFQDSFFNTYKKRLDEQVLGQYMSKEYTKEITNIGSKNYNDGYFIFNLDIKITVNKDKRISPIFNEETGKYVGDIKQQIGVDTTKESIIFKKVDNEYKIVYHGIIDPTIFNFEMDIPGGGLWQIQY